MFSNMNAAAADYPSGPSPYAYVPVDPFKPSLAFSLRNIFRRSAKPDVEAGDLLHSPPPPQPSRPTVEFETPIYKLRRKTEAESQPVQENPWSLAPDIDFPQQPRTAATFGSAVTRIASPHGSAVEMVDQRVRPEAQHEELASGVIVREAINTSSESKVAQTIPSEKQSRVETGHLPDSEPLGSQRPLDEPHAIPGLRAIPSLEQIQARMRNTRMLPSSSASQGDMTLTGPPTSEARLIFACRRCKMLKVRCEYPPKLKGICDRCHKGGHECIILGPKVRRAPPLQASSTSSVSTTGSAVGSLTSLPQSTVGVASGDSPEPDDVALPGPVPVQQAQGSTETSSDSLSHFNDLSYVPHPASAPPQSLPNPSSRLQSSEYGPSSDSQPDYRLEAQTLSGTQVETSTGGTDDQLAPGDLPTAQLGNTLQNQTQSVTSATHPQPLSACRRCKIRRLDCQYPAGLLGKCQHCQSGRHECVILNQPVEEDTSRPSFSRFMRSTTVPTVASLVAAYNSQHPPALPAWRTVREEHAVPENSVLRRPIQKSTFDDWSSPEPLTDDGDPYPSKTSTPLRPASPATSGSVHVPNARLSLQGDLSNFAATGIYRIAGTAALISPSFRTDSHNDAPSKSHSTPEYILAFLLDTVPRQIYLHLLLRLPYLYYSRVTRIFEEAEMSMPMIKQGILDAAKARAELQLDAGMGRGTKGGLQVTRRPYLPMEFWEPQLENAAYLNLQNTWQTFVDSLQKEWKTLNVISVLLLTAILTILQIPSAAADLVTRYTALLSMICALMSLLYGCIYIIRFGTMRKTYKGAEWAQEAQKSRTGIFWNVWVLLAMPATWLSWSMVMYIVTIMSFVWRTTPISQPSMSDESPAQVLIPRLVISLVVTLGVVYFFLIATTLRKYGEMMDRAWQTRIWGWMQDGNSGDLEKGRPKDAESSYEDQKPDGGNLDGTFSAFAKNGLNQRGAPQSSGSPIPKEGDQGVDVANAKTSSKAPPSLAPRRASVEVKHDSNALFGTSRQQPKSPPRMSKKHFDGENFGKTHESTHNSNDFVTAFSVSHLPGSQESHSMNLNPKESVSLIPAADATTARSPETTRPVRLFGLSEKVESIISLYNIAFIDDLNVENISGGEWDAFRKDVLKIVASSASDEAVQLDLSLLTPVLHEFNDKLRMHGSNGHVSVCREVADKGTDAYANYAVYYVSSSFEQSKY